MGEEARRKGEEPRRSGEEPYPSVITGSSFPWTIDPRLAGGPLAHALAHCPMDHGRGGPCRRRPAHTATTVSRSAD